jgi:large subunit ribosomal protein L29
MKTAELRQKDVAGLEAEVKALQKAHFGLRMQKATQQLNNNATLGDTRLRSRANHSGREQRAAAAVNKGEPRRAKASLKRTLIGKIVSDKRAKTVTVLVNVVSTRALRQDRCQVRKYHAHDERASTRWAT